MFLSEEDYSNVLKTSPVTALDFCITFKNKLLIAKRNNPPAKNYYFVPGGRIRKLESIINASIRILKEEIGVIITPDDNLNLLGIFEHFYKDNFLGNTQFNSHYIVLTYNLRINNIDRINSNNLILQHSEFLWQDLYKSPKSNIHKYTKVYIDKLKSLI
tara:strand:+ start:4097 stop:4573 length:477 start_codon:yes stop_codon:yes gene_type:complete